MNKEWTDADHVGKVVVSHLNFLSKEFHKHIQKPDEEKNYDLIIKLSSAAGYQAQLYSGIQKNHEFAKRLQSIERSMSKATPEDLAYKQNPVIIAEEELKSKQLGR
jgi:hypothetical protein